MRTGWFVLFLCLILIEGPKLSAQIIADHFIADATLIDPQGVMLAHESAYLLFGHTSHGSQLVSGMEVLAQQDPNLFDFNREGRLRLDELYGDLGHQGDLTWEQTTRQALMQPGHPYTHVLWSWCGGVSDNSSAGIQTYLEAMNQLERDFPEVFFIYMTGHLDGTGIEGNLHQRNEQIRAYCQSQGKILFDFADIESFDPDGSYFLPYFADDGCFYWSDGVQHNWAQEWCAAHPSQCATVSCAHSHALNCQRKGAALWWLLSELANANGSEPCLEAPQGLELTLLGREVHLTWAPLDCDGLILERSINDQSWAVLSENLIGSSTEFFETLSIEGNYAYRLQAILGPPSQPECQSPYSQTVTCQLALSPPQPPTHLQAVYEETRVLLTWQDASPTETHFDIERDVAMTRAKRPGKENAKGRSLIIATLPANTTTFYDADVTGGRTLRYRVHACNDMGSQASPWLTVEIPEMTFLLHLEEESELFDTFIEASHPELNQGAEPWVTEMDRYLVQVALPEFLQGKTIHSAVLRLYGWNLLEWQSGQTLKAHALSQAWEESSATWENAADGIPWSFPGGTFDQAPLGTIELPEVCDHCFLPDLSLTDLVQQWVSGCRPNHGLVIINDSHTRIGLKASEYHPGARTALELRYSNLSPLEDALFFSVLEFCWNPPQFDPLCDLDQNQCINVLDLILATEACF